MDDSLGLMKHDPRLRPAEVKYDLRWLGWSRSVEELWADAERFGLVVKAQSVHATPLLGQRFSRTVSQVNKALERVVVATFLRLERPALAEIEDERLAQELGATVYLLLAPGAEGLVAELKKATQQTTFCSVRSLCFGLGAYVKDHERAARLGVWTPRTDGATTYWRWGSAATFQELRSRYAPNAPAA